MAISKKNGQVPHFLPFSELFVHAEQKTFHQRDFSCTKIIKIFPGTRKTSFEKAKANCERNDENS